VRFRKERHPHGIDFNMTPLIDIVFLLIVFLMTVQELSRLELEEVDLPTADQARPLPQPPQRLVINVLPDGRLVVANQEMDLGQVWGLLERERDRLRASGREDDLTIIVRADGGAAYKHVQDLMSAAASLNIWRMTVAAQTEQVSGG